MAGRLNVMFSLQGLIREDHDTKAFVTYCPALDLYSAGRTRPDAKAALQGAIYLFIKTCYDRNILGGVLHERGFEAELGGATARVEGDTPNASDDEEFIRVSADYGEFDDAFDVHIPLHLVAQHQQQVGA